jgi:hypothetical protein
LYPYNVKKLKKMAINRTRKDVDFLLNQNRDFNNIINTCHPSWVVDSTTLNTGGDVTTTLTRAQTNTMFVLDGTGDLVVNMPALNTANVGTTYKFVVVTAVGGGKTATFVLPGSGVSNWHGLLNLTGNASTCAITHDVAGDTITMVNSTIVGTELELCCLTDDGTNSRWYAKFIGSPVATIA